MASGKTLLKQQCKPCVMETNKKQVRTNPNEISSHPHTKKTPKIKGENTLSFPNPDTRQSNSTTADGLFNTLSPDYKFSPVSVVQNCKRQEILH